MRLGEERGWGLMSTVLVIGILISLSLPCSRSWTCSSRSPRPSGSPRARSTWRRLRSTRRCSCSARTGPPSRATRIPARARRSPRALNCPSAQTAEQQLRERRLHRSRLDDPGARRHGQRVLRPDGRAFAAELGRERQREGLGPGGRPCGRRKPGGRRAREAHRFLDPVSPERDYRRLVPQHEQRQQGLGGHERRYRAGGARRGPLSPGTPIRLPRLPRPGPDIA